MGRRGKRALEKPEGGQGGGPEVQTGMTALEAQRAAIIARNRERLLALGIPSLVKELQQEVGGAAGGGAQPTKKRKREAQPRVKREPGAAEEQPTRRSSRLQDAAEHPKLKEETGEERLERELGKFVVEGECPRCGRLLDRGQRAHLQTCTGAKPARQPRQLRPWHEEELEDLDEAERQDVYQRTLARMKKVHLDALIDLTGEAAKFAVLGSTGNHYTVTLADDKHTCQCMDYRFRRHHCKHICAVLSQLGILDQPAGWRAAVEARMDELVAQQRQAHTAAERPRDKNAEVALKFL